MIFWYCHFFPLPIKMTSTIKLNSFSSNLFTRKTKEKFVVKTKLTEVANNRVKSTKKSQKPYQINELRQPESKFDCDFVGVIRHRSDQPVVIREEVIVKSLGIRIGKCLDQWEGQDDEDQTRNHRTQSMSLPISRNWKVSNPDPAPHRTRILKLLLNNNNNHNHKTTWRQNNLLSVCSSVQTIFLFLCVVSVVGPLLFKHRWRREVNLQHCWICCCCCRC